MAFSDYKSIGQTQKEFGIKYHKSDFILAQKIEPSEVFLQDFEFTSNNIDVFTSEGARTEAVIFPILREVYKSYNERFAFWIQKSIAYDLKLCGTPDYLIATKSPLGITVLETPFVAVVEAKRNDFEYGWGQCLAELVAAQKLNGDGHFAVHGIVTDGSLWQFGKLEKNIFTQNLTDYTTTNLPALFGALHYVFQAIAVQPLETMNA